MRRLALVSVLVIVLGACASPGQPSKYERSISEDTRWGVGAYHPVYTSLEACETDPSVETAVLSADAPPSRLGLRLVQDASEADALRVAECLEAALSAGDIWISSPKS